ncbi:MAG: MoaD/ThiS family protein [Saprospiraceae bacterium]|nr:MoaD/ThiS family protein [Saprospiraceae bacterium]
MPKVSFTYALKRFFPDIRPEELNAPTVHDLIVQLDEKYPGLKGYIVDDQGRLRQHVNIFVDGTLIRDREALSDPTQGVQEVYIMQALSGG